MDSITRRSCCPAQYGRIMKPEWPEGRLNPAAHPGWPCFTETTQEPRMFIPSTANHYQVGHTERLRRTFHTLTGRHLIDPALSPE